MERSRRRPVTFVLATLVMAATFGSPGMVPTTAALVSPSKIERTAQGGGKILRVHQGGFPYTLDPQKGGFVNEIAVYVLGYEGLTRLDADLQTVPAAAENWSFSEDGTVLTFRLRAGLTYSDGSPLTAQRFADAALRTCDPRTAALYASALFAVAGCQELNALGADADEAALTAARTAFGVTATDDRTLEIRLNHPAPYFPTVAATWVFFPVKRELIETGGDAWAMNGANHVGNGPFTITAIADQKRIAFRANEHYWAGRPKLDGIDYVYIVDNAEALAAYTAGDLDIVSVNDLSTVDTDPATSAQLRSFPLAFTSTFQFNLKQAPFDDQKVREAFAYAFDRETWCNEIQHGACTPTLAWIPAGVPGHLPTDAFAFDPEKAREALAASTYGNGKPMPNIELAYIGDPTAPPTPDWVWITDQFRTILGVEVTPTPLDGAVWAGNTSANATYPSINAFGGWGQDYPDPQNWLSLVYACDTFYAQAIGYCNEAFDAVIARADRELDPTKRLALYADATRLLYADTVAVMVSHNRANVLVKPTVTGLVATPSDFGFPGQYASLLTVDISH
jgi:oligopeptide transport system substrate-binding protein